MSQVVGARTGCEQSPQSSDLDPIWEWYAWQDAYSQSPRFAARRVPLITMKRVHFRALYLGGNCSDENRIVKPFVHTLNYRKSVERHPLASEPREYPIVV